MSDPIDRDRTAERLKGSARRGVRRLRERLDGPHAAARAQVDGLDHHDVDGDETGETS